MHNCLRPAAWVACLVVSLTVALEAQQIDAVKEAEIVRKSVVKIEATHEYPNYVAPWTAGGQSEGVGTGFIIDGKRVMTNAHVVSNCRYLEVRREGMTRRFKAKVKHVAHDCDLAILEVEDDAFFEDSAALTFGGVPKLNSTVVAYGYPIGGRRISLTRGIVSRIEFNTYSHTGLDQHLTIQVDAAINPGNSGGPIVQGGKVIGVAFQSYRGNVAQNTGYMIPTPVIKRMLKDSADGKYDGYVELAVTHVNLQNQAFRNYLGLPDNGRGVWVQDVMTQGSGAKVILPGDVLMQIDGFPIDDTGFIKIDDEKVQLEEVVERKFHGDKVKVDIIRKGKAQQVEITLKGASAFKIYSRSYGKKPDFFLFAGLLFQPLSRDVIAAHKINNPDIKYLYNFYIQDKIYLERPQLVALTAVVPDPINTNFKGFVHSLVEEVNDIKIRRLQDLETAFKKPVKHHVIRLYRQGRPIVIEAERVPAARKRIAARYGIRREQRLGEE